VQIERDTNGMLQCHPYPNEYVDASKPCPHCAFFMGLQRKEGVRGQEGQQFDIRGTVDEFRQDINMYMFWKPGMDIFVSHVRRKQLPAFVFPDGYKRSRLSRHGSQKDEKTCEDDVGCWSGSAERRLKRKNDPETVDVKLEKPEKRVSISPQPPELVTPESRTSRSGGVSQVSFSEGVRLECLTGHVDSNSEVRSSGGLFGNEEAIIENHVQMGETVVNDSVNLTEQAFVSSYNLPEVRNEVMVTEAVEKPDMYSQNGDKVEIAYMESAETGSTCRLLNWTEGAVDADQEVVKPCNQTMGKENAESVLEPSCSTRNLSCEVSFSV
jgi:poly(A) polymerase